VLQAPDCNVAVVAEQTTNDSCFVAVIEVETSAPFWVGRATDCTAAILYFEELFIRADRHAVVCFKGVVFGAFRIFSTPFARISSGMAKIVFSPFAVSCVVAAFAVCLIAVYGGAGFLEFGERLVRLAAWAGFGA